MSEETRQDIRTLLKRFGIKADEGITAHLEKTGAGPDLRLRLTLEEVGDHGVDAAALPTLTLEGMVRR